MNKPLVKRWMQLHVTDHVDRQTDEVNTTSLAEEAAQEFELYEDKRDYKIPEEVYDMAVDVGGAWEKKNRKASMYSYDRRADSNFGSYESRLEALQATFTGEVGAKVFEYIDTLHHRIVTQAAYEGISGFLSWDYGGAKQLGPNKWQAHVWQKDISTYPGDLEPNLFIVLEFDTAKVDVEVKAGRDKLYSKTVTQTSSSSSSIGMAIGEAWEKKLTGSVDYGK